MNPSRVSLCKITIKGFVILLIPKPPANISPKTNDKAVVKLVSIVFLEIIAKVNINKLSPPAISVDNGLVMLSKLLVLLL